MRIAPLCARYGAGCGRPLLVALLVVTLWACNDAPRKTSAPKGDAERGIALSPSSSKFLQIEAVGDGQSIASARLPGRLVIRPEAESSLGAPTAGRVASVYVRPGQSVTAGQMLLSIQSADAAAARATLLQASARAAAAEEALRRQTEMVSKGVGLELERFEAQTKAIEARAELDRAHRAAALIGTGEGDRVSLRAPRGGVVMTLKAAVGAMVAPGAEPLVQIGDASRLWVIADIPESDTAMVTAGQRATVFIPSARKELAGVVDGFGSGIDPESRRLPVYVALQGDVRELRAGMHAELDLSATVRAPSLPVTAVLIKDGKRRVVYVQGADGRFEAREVRTGPTHAGKVTILEGLQPGERVVVKGALLLDGHAEQLL